MSDPADRVAAALSDRYTIVRQLGAGGMATVYEAEDLKHQRKVALKVLKPELAAVVGTDRFLREIGVAARLNHPHILPLLDSGEAEGTLYFTMPLVTGPSLAQRIRHEGPLGLDEIRALVTDVASALDYAHAQGIVHRDLKPDNILLHHGKPMIADFGIALALSQVGGERLTETGLSIGTPQYMSPEQVGGDRTLDARSDVYALGCVVYEMLVGDPPFSGRTALAVMARQVTDPVPPIRTVRRDVPAAVDAAVTKALAKVPGDRFDSAGQLAIALATPESVSVQEISVSIERQEAAPRRTIAVLPFANLSTDPENEYFSDGITDDVMSQLSKVGELKVISRTSTTRFRDTELSLREIGEQLNADVILEGTVRKAGSRVRIVAQLIDARNDTHVWNATYDRMLTDVFEIQSEVAISIAEALEAELSPKERREIFKKPTDDLEAYDLYLLGRHHCNKRSADDLRRAITCFEQAIDRDAGYAEAYAGLAEAYVFAGIGYMPMPSAEAFALAKEMALRAIQLNPDRATAHATLGFTALTCDGDVATAERSLSHALELDSNYVQTYQWLGWCRTCVGDYFGGSEAWERALELDPLSAVITAESGWPFVYAGLYELAIERFQRALELDPELALAHLCVGWTLVNLGRYEEAIQPIEKGVLLGGAPFWRAFLASAYNKVGQRDRAETILEELCKQAEQQGGLGVSVAVVAEALGRKNLALDSLERAYSSRDDMPLYAIQITEFLPFASLRGHPRFQAIVDGLGFSPHDIEGERKRLLERERARTAAQAQKATENGEPTARTQGTSAAEGSGATGVAVLPFENLSPDPDNAYFSDGITEDVISHLCRIPGLKVISRTSIMQFKDRRDLTLRRVAEKLGVGAVLEGSVRRAGDRLRIVATLIDAPSENHLWTDTYDRRLTDIFEIQTDIATNIAAALRTTLSRADRARLEKAPTANMDAYGLWLRGRSAWAEMSVEGLERSLELFRRATELDPEFPHPYVGIADACIWRGIGLGVGSAKENCDAAKVAALHALELDDTLAEAHSSLAHVQCWFEWDWDAAERSFERALALNPSYALARQGYATHLTCTGRHAQAMAQIDIAEELDPLSLEVKRTRGWVLWHARDHDGALETLRQVLLLDPTFAPALLTIPWVATDAGRIDEAIDLARKAIDATNRSHIAMAALANAYARSGRPEEARRILDDIWALPESDRHNANGHVMPVYAALGDRDRALQHLELAYRGREALMMYVKVGTHFDGLRAEPRFRELVCELGLGDAPAAPQPDSVGTVSDAGRPSQGGTHDRREAVGVAVLPFDNLGTDATHEFFSDGITEDIITQLSKIRSLKVISRASSMRYKNAPQPLQQIAASLGVERVVQGSVRYAGDRVRITARLTEVGSDRELWAESYDRELSDVFAIQSDVAQRVAAALRAELTPAERTRIERPPTADMEAYRDFLLGRHHWARWTEDDFTESIRHFEAAIERDPNFAEAHVALSEAWSHLGTGYWTVRPLDAYPKARDAAMRAIELDPGSADAHARLAMVEWWFEFAFDRALARVQRAMSLNPNAASAFDYHANILTMLGRHDEALTLGKRACELDPASIFINANYGLYLYRARRWFEAIEHFERVIDLDPNLPMGRALQALAYVESGDGQRALEGLRRADDLSAGHHAYRVMLGYGHAAVGDRQRARQILREIEAVRAEQNIWLVMLAMGYAKLGETERALDLLDDAYRERGGWIVWAGVEPGLDVLRDQARFRTLMARLGLPQADSPPQGRHK